MPKSTPCKNPLFQFTPLREGRLSSSSRRQMPLRYFNSRPCGRGDRRARNHLCYACCISIHAPAGGATISAPRTAHSTLFQFTPLREGRPVPIPNLRTGETISIHAPAGGATHCGKPIKGTMQISIHAPAGGATLGVRRCRRKPEDFNSRPCGRGDDNVFNRNKKWNNISIHAPAGGATCSVPAVLRCSILFQFTPLREGRHVPSIKIPVVNRISIHAPAGGATAVAVVPFFTIVISIHAPAGGATHRTPSQHHCFRFQFTPLREGRRTAGGNMWGLILFQFTPLREGRPRYADEL